MLGNTLKIIRIITGTTAALAAILAVAAVINLKKRKAEEENKANEENKNDEIIIRGIAGNVPLYVGLYEGFYNIAYKNSEVMDSIEEWLRRTRNLEDYEIY
ncbi:MAG: hypothetical protein LIO44_00265 [Eubacterium sp.]|nr:hypothetical protein [Eubacterium sp.]